MRRLSVASLIFVLCVMGSFAWAASPKSSDGTFTYNREATYTLRASADETTTTIQTGSAVLGFGGQCHFAVFVDITDVQFTGGTVPTAQVEVWLQRTIDGGTTWDDVLALQSTALSASGAEQDAAFGTCSVIGGTPAAIQDAGGSPPFAQRSGYFSDQLRVKWQLIVTGAPSTQTVTFSVTAQARP